MANEIEIVKHVKKTRANLPATLEQTTIYFVTDEKKIQLGNDDYTGVTGITVNSGSKQTGNVSLTIPTQASDINAVPTTREVNGHALSSDITLDADDVSAVPTTRKVNGHALSSDITLDASDVSAVPKPSSATENNLALFDGSKGIKDGGYYISTQAPSASSGHTSIPTSAAVWTAIANGIRANDAMVFKGTIGSSGATVTSLPATHYEGWTYRVITAGTYAGQTCEIGDLIICVKDGTTASNSDWTVVQTNIDGAVIGPASSTDAHVVVFNGTTGKSVKDSGFTIGASVPSNAVFTDTKYKFTIGTTTRGDANGTDLGTLKKETEASGGTTLSLVETGDIFRWNRKTSKVDGLSGAEINRFATCSTAAATAQKEVTISVANGTFTLEAGAKVSVKFTYANTASNPTLKVGSNAAKNIFNKGSRITTGDNKALLCGVCDFIYDGTQFHLIGNYVGETQTLAVNDMDARIELSGGENNYVGFSSPSAGKLKLTDVDNNEFQITIASAAQPATTQSNGNDGLMTAQDKTKFELMWDALLWG